MTTNFQIETDRKRRVALTPIVGTNNSTLTIRLSKSLLAWNNEAVPGNNGLYDLNGEGFHVSDDPNDNVKEAEILKVEITGPTPILTTFQKLIFLKDEVKDIGVNAKNEFSFDLVLDKDISNQADHWNITALSAPGANDRVLKLSVADFGGTLDTSKISIDDTEYHNNPDNQIEVVVPRSDQKQALLDLEKLLNETLPSKYHGTKEFEHGPDVDLIDPSFDLGDLPDAAANPPVVASGLSAYYYGTHFDTTKPNIAKDAENIKHILRDLEDDAGDKIYEQQIDDWGRYLLGIKLWSSLGLTKKSQVAIILDTDGGGIVLTIEKNLKINPVFTKDFHW